MPVTEQPVATYLPMAFDAKLAECISKTVLSLPRTKRQFSVHTECLVLNFRSSPFCIMHLLYHEFRLCQAFFEFLFKFSCKNKRKNDFDFTNIEEPAGSRWCPPARGSFLPSVCKQTSAVSQTNARYANIPVLANKKAPLQEAFWKGCGGTLFHLKKVPPQSFKIISSNLLQEQRVPRRVLRERDRQLACRTP
jgi:hypothetical protein